MPTRPPFRFVARVLMASAMVALPAAARAQDGVRTTPPYAARGTDDPAPFTSSAFALRDSIVALARQQLGTRYVFGGTSPRRGFDCSGLVAYIARALHITVPRTARLQAHVGEAVPRDTSQLLPGDLLTFGRGSRISHIGIYVGNGRFIHASTKAGRVIETALIRPRARGIKPWQGARRLTVAEASEPARTEQAP